MPDNDIFRWHIHPRWRKAASVNFAADDDPNALPTAIGALGQEVKSGECRRLAEIVAIIEKAVDSPNSQTAQRIAFDELDHICWEEACDCTQIAANVARSIIIKGRNATANSRLNTAAQVLAGIAIGRMFSPAVIHSLAEESGVAYRDIISRSERRNSQIAVAPETFSLARMLLADPSGTSIKAPRPKRTRLPQAEILHVPLTSS